MDYEEKVPFRLNYLIVGLFLLIGLYMLVLAYLQITQGPVGEKLTPTWFYFVFGSLFLGFTWLITQFTTLSKSQYGFIMVSLKYW